MSQGFSKTSPPSMDIFSHYAEECTSGNVQFSAAPPESRRRTEPKTFEPDLACLAPPSDMCILPEPVATPVVARRPASGTSPPQRGPTKAPEVFEFNVERPGDGRVKLSLRFKTSRM